MRADRDQTETLKSCQIETVQRPPQGSTSLSMIRRIGPGADR
jgi:hypothetical protein